MINQSQPRSLAQSPQTNSLSIQIVGSETLVYDERRHLAFCLDQTASAVWTLANGQRSVAQIASEATLTLARPISEDIVLFALAQFQKDGLLATDQPAFVPAALSRRALIGRIGASAALLLPVVAVIAAPKAAQAYNGCTDCSNIVQNSQAGKQQAPAVQHSTQLGLPTYDPNHVHENDSTEAEPEKPSPEEQQ